MNNTMDVVMKSLELMGMGMAAIFVVLGAIAIFTYALGKIGEKKTKKS